MSSSLACLCLNPYTAISSSTREENNAEDRGSGYIILGMDGTGLSRVFENEYEESSCMALYKFRVRREKDNGILTL